MIPFNFDQYIKNNPLLKEEQSIELTSDLTATMASDASKKLTIPKGAKVTVVKKRLENEPNVTQLMYGDQKVNVSAGPFINQYLFEKEENKIGEASELKPLKKDDDVYEPEEQDDNEDSYDWFTDKYIGEAKQEWAVKNIEALINDYAAGKNLTFKPVDKKQQISQYGSKKTIYIYKLGDKDLVMIDDKAAGAPRLNDFKVVIGDMEPGTTSLKNTLSISKFGSWGTSDIIKMLDKAFGEKLNEGYAQFRNETKMRSKPDQFHQAVKQVKKKVNEINRLFEYMDRLKTELSEGESELKYKKYTENATKRSTKATEDSWNIKY